MARTFEDAHRWVVDGTDLVIDAASGLVEAELDAASALPGWSRRHVIAHVAANAEALVNLVRWAATGVETPMYSSPQDRAAGIERGAAMAKGDLVAWLGASAEELEQSSARLTPQQWGHLVVTAQGRSVPATETRWMRAREVLVHVVDLDAGIAFADLSPDFCDALSADILEKRGLSSLPSEVEGAPLPEVTAWLAGREHHIPDAPALGPWL